MANVRSGSSRRRKRLGLVLGEIVGNHLFEIGAEVIGVGGLITEDRIAVATATHVIVGGNQERCRFVDRRIAAVRLLDLDVSDALAGFAFGIEAVAETTDLRETASSLFDLTDTVLKCCRRSRPCSGREEPSAPHPW